MLNNKRERCPNWETQEKKLFRNILRPYLPILENRDLRTNTNKEKLKSWDEITEKFNLVNYRTRDKKQLMNQWKGLKMNSKKELPFYHHETTITDGESKPTSPPSTMGSPDNARTEFEVNFQELNSIEKVSKYSFTFGEASYIDMHKFRVLENERLQKEHEQRIKNMAETHNQEMINLKLQTNILEKTLQSLQNK